MTSKHVDPESKDGTDPKATLMRDAFDFFGRVLETLQQEPILSLAWGVEVLLFVILAFMVLSGGIDGEQAFRFAMLVVVSVVATLAVTVSMARAGKAHAAAPRPRLQEQARKCLDLLIEISEANQRILLRGASGAEAWARVLNDDYNGVCRSCAEHQRAPQDSGPHLKTICGEPDLKIVCDKKWLLGEALEDYRKRIAEAAPAAVEHDELETLIRRSVTQPALTPSALDTAARNAIEQTKRILAPRSRPSSSSSP